VHLARAFRDHFGVPITVYARRIQLDAAQRMLTDSLLPLSQVAALTGFADQSHLTRTMRSALGCTPGTLRRAALHRFKTAG
jgi:AraC family transcriptional regulator